MGLVMGQEAPQPLPGALDVLGPGAQVFQPLVGDLVDAPGAVGLLGDPENGNRLPKQCWGVTLSVHPECF